MERASPAQVNEDPVMLQGLGHVDMGVVAVVDPTSAGEYIAQRLMERGIPCLAVTTTGATLAQAGFTTVLPGDEPGLATRLRAFNPRAVIPGAESGVRTCEALAADLGLTGNDPSSTDRRRNKSVMARAASAAGLDVCRQALCASVEDCRAWAREIGYPVVVKPVASSGSDLVRICAHDEDVMTHAAAILAGDKYGQARSGVLIQEFMAGEEYTVDGVVRNGRLTVFAVGRYRKIAREGAVIYDKIEFFAPDDPAISQGILFYCDRLVDAVEARTGPVHIEIMLTPRGPMLVEIAARAHGGIATSVIDGSFSPSFIDAIIDTYLDPTRDAARLPRARRERAATICFLIADQAGTLSGIPGAQMIDELPSAQRTRWFVNPGEAIARTVDLGTCPGLIELSHEDPAVIEADIATIRRLERDGGLFTVLSSAS